MQKTFHFPSPIGNLLISADNGHITEIGLATLSDTGTTPVENEMPAIANLLTAYFNNPKTRIDLPLKPAGTPFQQRVWSALQNIPSGKTLTYGELAKKLKSGPRAIGQACRRNPIMLIIPCHRVVASTHLGGYAGATKGQLLLIKEWLLQHECAS